MKKSIKFFTIATTILTLSAILASCGEKKAANSASGNTPELAEEVTIKIGATSEPHAVLLEQVIAPLKAKGVILEIRQFPDYTFLNSALADKEIDANFFQHQPYLDVQNAESGFNLVSVGAIHIEPVGIYSNKVSSLDSIEEGAIISIPNDPSNCGRALKLLESKGIIKFAEGSDISVTVHDIIENPKNVQFLELSSELVAPTLQDVDLAVINSNYALSADLIPSIDALALESSKDNPYANIIAVRAEDKDKPEFQLLLAELKSESVKTFMTTKYQGSVIAAE